MEAIQGELGPLGVVDALFGRKAQDASFSSFDLADLDQDSVGDLTAFAGASTGLLSDDDVALAAREIEPGTGALLIVYENRWAGPFVAAVRRNGGELIAFERIRTRDLITALDAAEAAS